MIAGSKWEQLRRRMEALSVRESDIEEQFIRSGGPGGQHLNKASTCVMLRHRPSDIRVRCQVSRSQADNRFLARRILCEKIEERRLGAESEAARERARIRAQKRKRSKRAKEKMLRDKRARSETKELRGPVSWEG